VDEVVWGQLSNAYHGVDIGRMLKSLVNHPSLEFDRCITALEHNIYHQGSLYETTIR